MKRVFWLMVAIAFALLVAGYSVGVKVGEPDCHEDSVAMWDGHEHTVCMPLRDLIGPDESEST